MHNVSGNVRATATRPFSSPRPFTHSFLLLFQKQPDRAGRPRRANAHHLASHQPRGSVPRSRGQMASGGEPDTPVGGPAPALAERSGAQPYSAPSPLSLLCLSCDNVCMGRQLRKRKLKDVGGGAENDNELNGTSRSRYHSVSEDDVAINSKDAMTFYVRSTFLRAFSSRRIEDPLRPCQTRDASE